MDLQSVLNEVSHWPVADRLRLIEEVWSGLEGVRDDEEPSPDLKALLLERCREIEESPDDVLTWEQVKAEASSGNLRGRSRPSQEARHGDG